MALRLRRGTDAERLAFTPIAGEPVYTTDTKKLYVGDGSTVGGVPIDTTAVSLTLDDLTDVDTTTSAPTETDILQYISGEWIPQTVPNGIDEGNSYNIKIIGDDSTVRVDPDLGTFVGNLTGNVTGNVAGNLTGSVTGDVLGDLTGNVTGDVLGNVTGNVDGTVTGTLNGNVNGDVIGNLTGNVTGNVAGDVNGSIFADDSSLLVDGVNGRLTTGGITLSTDTITFGTGASPVTIENSSVGENPVLRWQMQVPGENEDIYAVVSATKAPGRKFNSSAGTLDTPTAPTVGFVTALDTTNVFNGTGFSPSSTIVHYIDPNGTIVDNTSVPGGVGLITYNNGSAASSVGLFLDSLHRVTINRAIAYEARATADINGTMLLEPQTAPPSAPVEGMFAVADRVTWDPATKGSGASYPVFYNGTVWTALF
jgi:outer membrane lipoprotein SlyB